MSIAKKQKVVFLTEPKALAVGSTDKVLLDNYQVVNFYLYATENSGGLVYQFIATNEAGQEKVLGTAPPAFTACKPLVLKAEADKLAHDGYDRVYLKLTTVGGTTQGCVFAVLSNERYSDE